MLKEEHRIITTDRRPQQSVGVQSIGRKHHANPWRVGKDALAALRVVDRTAGQISADGDPYHHRRRVAAIGAPAQQAELIAQLMHRRPDVVEELHLDHWLESARGHADGAADDVGFRQAGVVDAVGAELPLQPGGELEDTALAFHQAIAQLLILAGIGDVLAEDARCADLAASRPSGRR